MAGSTSIWSQFPAELSEFARQLRRHSKTEVTGNALEVLHGSIRNAWRSEQRVRTADGGIPIPVPRNQALHPVGSTLVEAFIAFDFLASAGKGPRTDFQVRVTGNLALDDCEVHLEDHWRVDTDLNAVATAREPHPAYHFQRGGHAQEAFAQKINYVPGPSLPGSVAKEWFGLLQCSGPRMLTPPMCPILAIDFAISQHDGPLWRTLRASPEYFSRIKKAQERLWAPFFQSLNDPKQRLALIGPIIAFDS